MFWTVWHFPHHANLATLNVSSNVSVLQRKHRIYAIIMSKTHTHFRWYVIPTREKTINFWPMKKGKLFKTAYQGLKGSCVPRRTWNHYDGPREATSQGSLLKGWEQLLRVKISHKFIRYSNANRNNFNN